MATKVFISIPMNGRTDEEILNEMESLKKELTLRFPTKTFEFIDSFTKDQNLQDKGRIAMLGHSISLMADADLVFFAKGYEHARGCRIEEQVAIEYGIQRQYFENKNEYYDKSFKHDSTVYWR